MDDITEDVIPVNITDELKSSYMDYAMSVIVGRALPDARDGLKPVHRRTLYAMFRLNNEWNRPHLKSARIVGGVNITLMEIQQSIKQLSEWLKNLAYATL